MITFGSKITCIDATGTETLEGLVIKIDPTYRMCLVLLSSGSYIYRMLHECTLLEQMPLEVLLTHEHIQVRKAGLKAQILRQAC